MQRIARNFMKLAKYMISQIGKMYIKLYKQKLKHKNIIMKLQNAKDKK